LTEQNKEQSEKRPSRSASILGWLWAAPMGLFGLGLLQRGHLFGGIMICTSALVAAPLFWDFLRKNGFVIPKAVFWIIGVAAFFLAASDMPKADKSEKSQSTQSQSLAEVKIKIHPSAVSRAKQQHYPKLYADLGAEAVNRANDLTEWAAVIGAESDKCNRVEIDEISSKSSKTAIEWFVDCENGERFQITEKDATETRDRWQSVDEDGQLNVTETVATVAPNSSALEDVSEVEVVTRCDRAAKIAMKSQSSFDAAWSWKFMKHPKNGRVTVIRDFEAQNAFGANLSSQYECIVDAKSMELLSLRVREPTGWDVIYSK